MTLTAVADHCSWFPEWIGSAYIGACCATHDLTSRGWLDFGSHIRLGHCVARTSAGPFWGGIVAAGPMLGGGLYAVWSAIVRRTSTARPLSNGR